MGKRQLLNSGFRGKKGFVFTMDVAVALIVVFALLFTASFFVVKKTQDPFPTLQLIRVGSDIIKIMEYKGYFNNPDNITITDYLNNYLPPNLDMYIEGSSNGGCFFQAGNMPPEDKVIVSSKDYFKKNNEFCSMRYKVWLK